MLKCIASEVPSIPRSKMHIYQPDILRHFCTLKYIIRYFHVNTDIVNLINGQFWFIPKC